MDPHLVGWLASPFLGLQTADSEAEEVAARIERRAEEREDRHRRDRARFREGFIGAMGGAFVTVLGWGIIIGIYGNRVSGLEQTVSGKVDAVQLSLTLRAYDVALQAVTRTNEGEDAQIRELQLGRESNRIALEQNKGTLDLLKARIDALEARLNTRGAR